MLRPRDFRQGHWRWIQLSLPHPAIVRKACSWVCNSGKKPFNPSAPIGTVCKRNQLFMRGFGRSAGIANAFRVP